MVYNKRLFEHIVLVFLNIPNYCWSKLYIHAYHNFKDSDGLTWHPLVCIENRNRKNRNKTKRYNEWYDRRKLRKKINRDKN